MRDVFEIFYQKQPVESKLQTFGFKHEGENFVYNTLIFNAAFTLYVTVFKTGKVTYRVIDNDTKDEYLPLRINDITGSFVGAIKTESEAVLREIAEKCFVLNVFQSPQTQRIIEHVRLKYKDELEFLWPRFPNCAVWRRKDTQKWYGVVLTVSQNKLGLSSSEKVEIADLRGKPDVILKETDYRTVFPGWHMNKKNWYTVILNDSLSTADLQERIEKSYLLAINK